MAMAAALSVPAFALSVSGPAAEAAADSLSPAGAPEPGGSVIFSKNVFLKQLHQRDSILIADQLVYGVTMDRVEEGTEFLFPEYRDTICSGVTVVRPWQLDTVRVHREKKSSVRRYDLVAGMLLTSFDEGRYRLPNIVIQRLSPDGTRDTLVYEGAEMDVRTMPVDTSSFVVRDIKGQIRYPLTAAEVLPWVGLFYGTVLLAIAVACLCIIYRRRDGENVRHDPAHIIALRKLDRYRDEKFRTPEKQKAFYSGVTDVLREYVAARYGVGAMEMTTAEIFSELNKVFSEEPAARKELLERLKGLFEMADFVKFAKLQADASEVAAALPLAVRFVTETYQSEIQEEADKNADKADKSADKKEEA